MEYIKKIDGEICYLSPLRIEDAELFTRWLNDTEVLRFLNLASASITLESEREILDTIARKHNYGIVESEGNRLIGICGFVEINNLNQTGECGIFIGDKEYWGRGFGTRALECLISYGFDYLNLHNIMLKVYSYNERGFKSYKKCGFKEIGRRRDALLREGRRWDEIMMDIIPDDFKWKK